MNDGSYTVEVALSGGTGRATVKSPAELTVSGADMTARIEWNSPHYDLMIVDGERYLPVNKDGDSVFLVPVSDLGVPLDVEAETVAMSEPHLIAYTLTFDPDSVKPAGSGSVQAGLWIGGAAVLLALVLAAAAVFARRKKTA